MNTELNVLALSVILALAHLFLTTLLVTKQRGPKWNMSSRDENPPPLKGLAARMDRSFTNFKETYPLFIAAIVAVVLMNANTEISAVAAWVYLLSRLIYIPCYVFNIVGIRSLVWLGSVLGIIGILSQVWI